MVSGQSAHALLQTVAKQQELNNLLQQHPPIAV